MKVSLKFDNVYDEDQEYLADMIVQVVDRILHYEETSNKVDSIILRFQNGSEEEEIR